MDRETRNLLEKLGIEVFSGLEVKTISTEKLESKGIRYSKFLNDVFFEASVNMQSPIISPNKEVYIGRYSYMNDGGYVRNNTYIGRYCSIGRRVTISAGMHNVMGLSSSPSLNQGISYNSSESELLKIPLKKNTLTRIEHDVWIGDGAIIMPGVTVGTGSVIAANSVVTKDVAPYTVVGGVPAKLIKNRFPADIVSSLITSKWWELAHETITSMNLNNIFLFVEEISDFTKREKREEEAVYLLR